MRTSRMLTITAPSDEAEYKITKVYDSGTEEQVVEGGDCTGKITYAAKSGYMFAGWYQDADFTVPADFADVNADMTVYAKYVSSKDVKLAFKRTGKMRKKYSDPLMFSSVIMSSILVTPSQHGTISPDDELDDDQGAGASVFSVNSAAGAPVSEDPVSIVNPVEEAVNSASTSVTTGITTESPVEAVSTSPLEVTPVIEEIVPEVTEEAASAGTTQ